MWRLIVRIYNMSFRQGVRLQNMEHALRRIEIRQGQHTAMLEQILTEVTPGPAVTLGVTAGPPVEQPR